MSDPKPPSRRGAIRGLGLAGLGLAGLAGVGVLAGRQADRGSGGHDAYFQRVARALRDAGIAQPTLVIDRARLLANIAAVKANLAGSGLGVRVVVKSLPAIDLIDTVASGLETHRFMVFNGPMLHEMHTRRPDDDLLIGDLVAVHWKDQSGGKILVEPKADIKERIGRSTDYGDAVVMAFWEGAQPGIDQWIQALKKVNAAAAGRRRAYTGGLPFPS